MVPSAYLRVFQPLDGFERDEQLHWERWLLTRRAATGRPRYADRETGVGVGLLAPAGRRARGRSGLRRPHLPRARPHAAARARGDRGRSARADGAVGRRSCPSGRRAGPGASSAGSGAATRTPSAFVQQSPWHVPIRWFALFRPEERSIADDERGRLRLRYRTATRRAMRRAENAIPTLRRSDLGAAGGDAGRSAPMDGRVRRPVASWSSTTASCPIS